MNDKKQIREFENRLHKEFPHYKGIDSNGDLFLQGGDEDDALEMLKGIVSYLLTTERERIEGVIEGMETIRGHNRKKEPVDTGIVRKKDVLELIKNI